MEEGRCSRNLAHELTSSSNGRKLWAETCWGAAATSSRSRKCFRKLAARLNLVVRRALEQAAGSVAAFAPTQILWAPGRVRVFFHDGWHESEIDGTLESLEAAVFSATYSAVEASQDY